MIASFIVYLMKIVSRLVGQSEEAYSKYAKFSGITQPINCLSFNRSGELLASGGDDETVRIWDVSTKKCLHALEDAGKKWGQITCLTWLVMPGGDELRPIVFGTGRGLVLLYRRSRADMSMVELANTQAFEPSDPVEAMAYDSKTYRLALTSHFGHIALYEISKNGTMLLTWSTKVNNDKKVCIPRSIKFHDDGKKILIFILETGEMICRDVQSSRVEWRKVLKSGIGNASISSSGKALLVENLSKGFDLYDLPQSSPAYSFAVPTKKRCVKEGIFGEQDSVVICGTDHGKIVIFPTASATPQHILKHGGPAVDIQTLAATSTLESHLIASGSSSESSDIIIWEKKIKKIYSATDKGVSTAWIAVINIFFMLILLFLTAELWVPGLQTLLDSSGKAATPPVESQRSSTNLRSGYSKWTPDFENSGFDDKLNENQEISEMQWKTIEELYLGRIDRL